MWTDALCGPIAGDHMDNSGGWSSGASGLVVAEGDLFTVRAGIFIVSVGQTLGP